MRSVRIVKRKRPGAWRHGSASVIAAAVVAALLTAACSNGSSPAAGSSPVRSKAPTPIGSRAGAVARTIPQPTVKGIPVAPENARVDVAMPTFSDPTNITNPLFPVSMQESVLLLGKVDDKAFRTEVTLLPDPRIIQWEGQQVPALVSQYVAFLDGRIHEVAYDFYAQADDGSVWYFGEDVYNFKDGAIADTHGTWIAGRDGPAAMIMPADPQVGDVYRPENIPGFVFEEVTVKGVDETLPGPLGPVQGGLRIEELHMDGATESKTFVPGYGEFFTSGGGDVEALALAVPTDASSEPLPAELSTLERGAALVLDAAGSNSWNRASTASKRMAAAWEAYAATGVPKRIEPRMARSLATIADAVHAHNPTKTRQAAIDATQSILDLQLRYRPAVEVDLARFDLWLAQLLVDAKRGDAASLNGDFFTLDYIRDRIMHALDEPQSRRLNLRLEELLGAIEDGDLGTVTKISTGLHDMFEGITRAE